MQPLTPRAVRTRLCTSCVHDRTAGQKV